MAEQENDRDWRCRIAAIPMGLLALSCLYPMFFAVNNALKTRHDYMLDRFGLALHPTFDNFVQAWTRSHLDEYFLNSVIATVGRRPAADWSSRRWPASPWRRCAFPIGASCSS